MALLLRERIVQWERDQGNSVPATPRLTSSSSAGGAEVVLVTPGGGKVMKRRQVCLTVLPWRCCCPRLRGIGHDTRNGRDCLGKGLQV